MDSPGSPRGWKAHYEEWREATLSPLDERFFRTFWFAALATHFGSVVQSMAAFWLMHEMTPRADMVGLVQTAASLPLVVFALLAGALTDSIDLAS